MTGIAGWVLLRPIEPSGKDRRMSEWLAAYDSHNRFDEGGGRRSLLSDTEIEVVLGAMRARRCQNC